MSATLTDQIFAALAEFSSASRLYELEIGQSEETGLLVEAFVADEAVQEVGARDVIALSTPEVTGMKCTKQIFGSILTSSTTTIIMQAKLERQIHCHWAKLYAST